jgi:hypothetical protein
VNVRLVALAAILASCSSSAAPASNGAALARDAAVQTLAAGRLDSLPTGSIYMRFVRFVQPPGYVINSKQHVASFVYVQTGVHELVLAGQSPLQLQAGEATFHQSVTHKHLNPGSAASEWYSIALWPSSARSSALVDPIAAAAYESGDIDLQALPQTAFSQVLRKVKLAKDGTAGAHRFGGLCAFYVLSGSLTIRSSRQQPVTLGAGKGATFLPDVALQESNAGTDDAVYLEFVTTAIGKAFDVPLPQPPAS